MSAPHGGHTKSPGGGGGGSGSHGGVIPLLGAVILVPFLVIGGIQSLFKGDPTPIVPGVRASNGQGGFTAEQDSLEGWELVDPNIPGVYQPKNQSLRRPAVSKTGSAPKPVPPRPAVRQGNWQAEQITSENVLRIREESERKMRALRDFR